MADHHEEPQAASQDAEPSRAELEEALSAARAQADEYLRLLQRTKADFVNYQRRAEQERAEQERYAAAAVLLRIVPILDDLERALASMPGDLGDNPWAQGMALIDRKLKATLEQVGLRPIAALGEPFNPLEHEAVGQEPSPPEQEGLVVTEVERGYRLHDRLLRPARVRVGRSTAEVGG